METRSGREMEQSTEQLLEDLRDVVQDGEELLRAGANELSEQGSVARERLSAALDRAKETGRKLQQQTIAGAKATDRAIRENPYQSVGIAFGVGILLGAILNRR